MGVEGMTFVWGKGLVFSSGQVMVTRIAGCSGREVSKSGSFVYDSMSGCFNTPVCTIGV